MFTHFSSDPDMETICLMPPSFERTRVLGLRGDQQQTAPGRSKGGFTTKIHALADALGNPLRVCLTGGHRHDVTQAVKLLEGWETERIIRVLGDKGYDADSVLAAIQAMGAEVVIPPK
jgi:hypothetical protein